ncbi:MAG: 5-formyltetrahydrofolate cyclo-ligase [Nitrospinales bacterium]
MVQSISASTVAEQKASQRKEISALLKSLDENLIYSKSESIADKIISLNEFQKARNILVYLSLETEVQTDALIKKMFEMGKKVFLPIVDDKNLVVSELLSLNINLIKGTDGIRVPDEKDRAIVLPEIIDFVVVPGLAFSAEGVRLGRGKGCYDKLLAGLSVWKVGVAFNLQILDFIPLCQHDIGMDKVITESEIFNC